MKGNFDTINIFSFFNIQQFDHLSIGEITEVFVYVNNSTDYWVELTGDDQANDFSITSTFDITINTLPVNESEMDILNLISIELLKSRKIKKTITQSTEIEDHPYKPAQFINDSTIEFQLFSDSTNNEYNIYR